MTSEEFEVLAEHRLDRLGLRIKLDKGFKEGTYCIYIEFDDLAERVGFTAARHAAQKYCVQVKAHLGRVMGRGLGRTDDASLAAGPGRKRDLEATFLSFQVTPAGQHCSDRVMTKHFRLALLRADQEWDQSQASIDAMRRNRRRAAFEQRLAAVLASEAYLHLDAATKERLLADVTQIVFPATWRGL